MEFKTKYNLGDKFWLMEDNKPYQFSVDEIHIGHYLNQDVYKSEKTTYVKYTSKIGPKIRSVAEGSFYETKAQLLATL